MVVTYSSPTEGRRDGMVHVGQTAIVARVSGCAGAPWSIGRGAHGGLLVGGKGRGGGPRGLDGTLDRIA